MALVFKRKESVAKATRRLGRDRMEHALECLKECDRAGSNSLRAQGHQKDVRCAPIGPHGNPKGRHRRITKVLREAAGHLAALRDAYVKARTLKSLAQHFKGQLAPAALRHVRADLRRDSDEEMRRFAK